MNLFSVSSLAQKPDQLTHTHIHTHSLKQTHDKQSYIMLLAPSEQTGGERLPAAVSGL